MSLVVLGERRARTMINLGQNHVSIQVYVLREVGRVIRRKDSSYLLIHFLFVAVRSQTNLCLDLFKEAWF